MLYLSDKGLADQASWQQAGFALPRFHREEVRAKTKANPTWVHFGAGNIFRAFPAMVQQKLLDEGIEQTGIIVAEGYDYEILDLVNTPYDDLTLLVTLKADGSIEKTVVGSVVESLKVDTDNAQHFARLQEIFAAPSLQMVSFTITEKGYSLKRGDGSLLPDVEKDLADGPAKPRSYIGKLTALCYHRWQNGAYPLALVSMDNCSHNGDRLFEAVSAFARQWADRGLVEQGFVDWVENPNKLSFPWSMIDKITPRPDDSVKAMLQQAGLADCEGRVTGKNTYVAPFVNAEETQYLVIEDAFPNGRPKLELGGVVFTSRETVDKVEKMKVCTCLNPLHTALAIFGCLLSYHKISDEMKDPLLVKLIERVGYQEGLPVVVDPGVLSPKAFIDTVIGVRLPNPFMPDTPQRIATDTSLKLPIRFGETIKAYLASDQLKVQDLVAIPLTLAGWCRYLMGIDDNGRPFEPSPDPALARLRPHFEGVALGAKIDPHQLLQPVLSDPGLFGVNLYDAGLAQQVEGYFAQMIAGEGAVRQTLQQVLSSEK